MPGFARALDRRAFAYDASLLICLTFRPTAAAMSALLFSLNSAAHPMAIEMP